MKLLLWCSFGFGGLQLADRFNHYCRCGIYQHLRAVRRSRGTRTGSGENQPIVKAHLRRSHRFQRNQIHQRLFTGVMTHFPHCLQAGTYRRAQWRVKMPQRMLSSKCTHRVLAGLPNGIPGIGLEIEGAIQQAPQSERQSIGRLL